MPFLLFKYFEDYFLKFLTFRESGLSRVYTNLLGRLKTVYYETFSRSESVLMGFHSYLTAQLSEFINTIFKPKNYVMFLVGVLETYSQLWSQIQVQDWTW